MYLGGDAVGIIQVLDVADEEFQVPLSHEREGRGGGAIRSFVCCGSKTVGCYGSNRIYTVDTN